jgi:predicted phosphodiesterase
MLQSLRHVFRKPSVSLQVLSDLHLEVNQQYSSFEIPASSKYLVLAGDVGCLQDYEGYLAFLKKQTDIFEIVLLVLGNHEFYNDTFQSGLEQARKLEHEPMLKGRLVLLHQRRYDIPGSHVTVLGCTLWSRIPEESEGLVVAKVQDFKTITSWSIDSHNSAHESDLTWLRGQVQEVRQENDKTNKKTDRRSIVVVTHHAPSVTRTSSPKHAENPWTCAFGTDLLSGPWNGVNLWIFGHTHFTTEFKERDIRVISNQRGYVLPGSKQPAGFDPQKVVYVP